MKSETSKKRGRKPKSETVKTETPQPNVDSTTAEGTPTKKHYINNAEFEFLIREYYRTDVFSEELGVMINKISEHVMFMPRFISYTSNYSDSMISDSNYKMIKALNERKFDPDRGSAFSYFTRICINSFFFVTEKERKNKMTISQYRDELYDELESNGYIVHSEDSENHME